MAKPATAVLVNLDDYRRQRPAAPTAAAPAAPLVAADRSARAGIQWCLLWVFRPVWVVRAGH